MESLRASRTPPLTSSSLRLARLRSASHSAAPPQMRRGRVAAVCVAILLVAPAGTVAPAQDRHMPPVTTPIPRPDFHFSDPARDAQYWRLEAESERALATFHESVLAARQAIFRDRSRPSVPVQPGTAEWLEARAAVERAIQARRGASDAISRVIAFATRAGREVSPREAEYALNVRHANEDTLRATSDTLVNLLARLAGITVVVWPA